MELGETEKLQRGNTEFTLQSRWDRFALSVRPKSYKKETLNLHCNLGETDFDNGHTQRDYNPISVRPRSLSVRPICLGFVAVAMTFEIGGA